MVGSSKAAAPNISYFFPAGAQRGTTTQIAATGSFDKWPASMWASGKGVSIKPGKDKGTFAVTVSEDAIPGMYWLRASNEDGASGLRPFFVGTLPEVVEKEPNDEPRTAQTLNGSTTVNGRLAKAGDVDCFAIMAKKGQTLVAALEANRTLKSPMDAVLQVVSADGFVLDQNHDFHGLDPQIAYAVPRDGAYVVRVFAFPSSPDTTIRFAGAETYIYRLTIATAGFLDYTMPLAVGPKVKSVAARGWNIPDSARTLTPVFTTSDDSYATVFHPELASSFPVRVDPHALAAAPSALLTPPFSISRIVANPGAQSLVPFAGKKGQSLSVRVESRSLGLALDPVVRILDKDQKQLARAEPPKLASDTALSFAPPADGTYTIAVSDLYGGGGPRHAFLLRIAPPEPDYDLSVAADRFVIPPGKSLEIPVKVARKNGFAGPVEIAAEGLPTGVTWELKPPVAKADPNLMTVSLRAEKLGLAGPFRLIGKVKDGPALTRTARAPLTEFETTTADLWVAVTNTPAPAAVPKKKKR
jgi:hypothetical protein